MATQRRILPPHTRRTNTLFLRPYVAPVLYGVRTIPFLPVLGVLHFYRKRERYTRGTFDENDFFRESYRTARPAAYTYNGFGTGDRYYTTVRVTCWLRTGDPSKPRFAGQNFCKLSSVGSQDALSCRNDARTRRHPAVSNIMGVPLKKYYHSVTSTLLSIFSIIRKMQFFNCPMTKLFLNEVLKGFRVRKL